MDFTEQAVAFGRAGLCPIPMALKDGAKRAAIRWGEANAEGRWGPPEEKEIRKSFEVPHTHIGIITGAVSFGLICFDFDVKLKDLFQKWYDSLPAAIRKGINEAAFVERSPSGGTHVVLRMSEADWDPATYTNEKLASSRSADGQVITCIETRGQGGLFVCDPSPGYKSITGTSIIEVMDRLMYWSKDEVAELYNAARALNEVVANTPKEARDHSAGHNYQGSEPWMVFNSRANMRSLIESYGWKFAHRGPKGDYFTRPGKKDGVSGTVMKNAQGEDTLYVHSSNAAPLDPNCAYDAWGIHVNYEHGGNFKKASSELAKKLSGNTTPTIDFTPSQKGLQAASGVKPERKVPNQKSMMDYVDFVSDPGINLIGDGFLRKGQTGILVGPSGHGKSSLAMQMAARFATGQDFFGMPVKAALKVLIIQAENDDDDLHEEARDIFKYVMKPADAATLKENVMIATCHYRGEDFVNTMATMVKNLKPDLVIVDPLMAYYDGDVNDAKEVGAFLREKVQPVVESLVFGLIIVAHPPKAVATIANEQDITLDMMTYAAAGSVEFANFARCSLYLQPLASGAYKLNAAKRGKRAQLKDAGGNKVRFVELMHGSGGIYWTRADMSKIAEDVSREKKQKFVEECAQWMPLVPDTGITRKDLVAEICTKVGWSDAKARSKISSADQAGLLVMREVELAVESGRKHEQRYFKPETTF